MIIKITLLKSNLRISKLQVVMIKDYQVSNIFLCFKKLKLILITFWKKKNKGCRDMIQFLPKKKLFTINYP
jgi:hypothetical protein